MADVIVIMRDGIIEQTGRPLDVYDRPDNLFVAQFIGSPAMNLIPGEVAVNGGPVLQAEGMTLPLPASAPVTQGQKVVFGIRPEHLKPSRDGGAIAATVSTVEPTGPEIHLYAEAAGRDLCAITQERISPRPGDSIMLTPAADRIHLFDEKSGKRLEARS